MAFAAIYIPDFPLQAAVRAQPAPAGTAIALVDGTPPAWTVVAVNQPAFRAGVELGMARALALQFEGAQVRFRSRAHEKSAHAALLDLAWSISPRVEDTASDSILIDLAGLSSVFGSDENIADRLAQRVSALGLTAHIAVASNLEIALHAARGFPGITVIAAGEESKCLGRLPVAVLGPSAETLQTLDLWGVRTCEALAALPVLQLSERLGQEGVLLHQWARGAGSRSMVLAEPSSRFEEEMEFENPVGELEPLAFLLGRLLDRICARLAARSLAVRAIQLRFSLDPSGPMEIQVRDDCSRRKAESHIYERTLSLPVPMRDSKMLLNLVRLKLQADPPQAPILKAFMAAEAGRPRALQTGLFLPPSPDAEKLELTVARLANLVGDSNVGSPRLVDTHRPGRFRMDRYSPICEETRTARRRVVAGEVQRPAGSGLGKTAIGFRMFRPPLPATVRLRAHRPQAVSFRGFSGEVIAASGPWRTAGDWWGEELWREDEWDLEIGFPMPSSHPERDPASFPRHGLYRFYFDWIRRKWFVRGTYD